MVSGSSVISKGFGGNPLICRSIKGVFSVVRLKISFAKIDVLLQILLIVIVSRLKRQAS
jgi:hypothetical protein